MKILFVTPELFPYAKTGGLADYAWSLSRALYSSGHDIRIIMPRYKSVKKTENVLTPAIHEHPIDLMNSIFYFDLYQTNLENRIPVFFVVNDGFFDRDELYHTRFGDYPDNAVRFIFFNRAVIESIKRLDFRPDIIHCNDWQTALIPVYVRKMMTTDSLFKNTTTLLTIHNLAYQGIFWHFDMKLTGLDWEYYSPDLLEYYGRMNLLKGGIACADAISTVSETYAREIQTSHHGFGLDSMLKKRRNNIFGILNGIDQTLWSPDKDPMIPYQYSSDSLENKVKCKQTFLKSKKLNFNPRIPLVCMITRLETLKGIDLLLEMSEELMELPLQFVILGKGRDDYKSGLHSLEQRFFSKMRFFNIFNEQLAHEIEAASDIILFPSLSEPCGLNNLYSMRYGTVPIVRKTGGLADTVIDYRTDPINATGFTFVKYSTKAFLASIKRALNVYLDRDEWRKIMVNGMTRDFSWSGSVRKYEKIYQSIMKNTNSIRKS